jgi:hypothetical protein
LRIQEETKEGLEIKEEAEGPEIEVVREFNKM